MRRPAVSWMAEIWRIPPVPGPTRNGSNGSEAGTYRAGEGTCLLPGTQCQTLTTLMLPPSGHDTSLRPIGRASVNASLTLRAASSGREPVMSTHKCAF